MLWGGTALALFIGWWLRSKSTISEQNLAHAPANNTTSGSGNAAIGGNLANGSVLTGQANTVSSQTWAGSQSLGDVFTGNKHERHFHVEIKDPSYFINHADPHEQPFDYEICQRSNWGHLNAEAIITFLRLERVSVQEDCRNGLSPKQQFEAFRFIRDGAITYGVALCFGESPHIFIAGCETRCFYWKDKDRRTGFHEEQSIRDNIMRQFEGAISFLKKNLRLGGQSLVGVELKTMKYRWRLYAKRSLTP